MKTWEGSFCKRQYYSNILIHNINVVIVLHWNLNVQLNAFPLIKHASNFSRWQLEFCQKQKNHLRAGLDREKVVPKDDSVSEEREMSLGGILNFHAIDFPCQLLDLTSVRSF